VNSEGTAWAKLRATGVRAALAIYKKAISSAIHALAGAQGACRFQPSCSEYAAIAIAEHGALRGALMTAGRLLRCHPLHPGGFDPVPAKRNESPADYSGRAIS
jgi:putative membrane protein insertion efficiency factor